MCDKVNLYGACFAEKDVFRPLSGMDTQCLTEDMYKTYECPKGSPHKCKFHGLTEPVEVAAPQLFGHCPSWVGNQPDSGMCDKVNLYGACFAEKDVFRPLSGMDTQCLTEDMYKTYECPEGSPHKCKFHGLTEPVEVATPQLFGHCSSWVGNSPDSGMCDKVNQYGACFAEKDVFRPSAGMDTQCLSKDEYKTYKCAPGAPHKCKFHWLHDAHTAVLV